MGGIGVQTIADGNASYFSALVILSGYNAGVDLNQFKGMPVKAYAGSLNAGEASASYNFTVGNFDTLLISGWLRVIKHPGSKYIEI